MKKELSYNIRRERALKLSKKEGAFASINSDIVLRFIVPFALALQASNFLIGILSSFVGLISPITQISSSHLMEKYSRKKIVLVSAILQVLILIPIIILGLLFHFSIALSSLPVLLVIFYSLYVGIGAIIGPAWFSWIGDLAFENRRGDYFSKRNRLIGIVGLLSVLTGGFFLDHFKTQGLALIGFAILFSIAVISRIISIMFLSQQFEPKLKLKKGYYFSFYDFIKHSMQNNFGRFALFMGLVYLAVSIASPFFAVYMLRELKFSYTLFIVVSLSASVFSIIALPFWGRIGDRYGNHLVLKSCSFFIPLVPLLWLVSSNPIYLIFVPSLIAGVFWGGFNLAASNFIYDSTRSQHRALCNAYINVFLGFGIFFGSLIGAAIVKYVEVDFLSSIFLFIFLVSGLARLAVVFLLMPTFHEVRSIKKPSILIKKIKYLGGVGHDVSQFRNFIFSSNFLVYSPSFVFTSYVGKIFR